MESAVTAGGEKDQLDRAKRARSRSLAIAWALGILVVLFYAATLVRLGPNALRRDDFSRTPGSESSAVPAPAAPDSAECKKAGTC